MLFIFGVLIWIFWYFFQGEVREMVRWIRYAEVWVISWFMDTDYEIFWNGKPHDFHEKIDKITEYPKDKLRFKHLSFFNAMAMQPWRMPLVSLLGLGAMWCMFLGPRTHYRRRFNLEGLIERQANIFPVISPFVKFNPSNQPNRPPGSPVPAELPLFAEALGPEEWLAFNRISIPDGKIDQEEAEEAFIKQLGERWKGPNSLEDYKQVLLAAFCMKAARKRGDADEILGRLAKCWSFKNGLDMKKDRKLFKYATNILKDKDLAGKTLAQVNQHAFETTALMKGLAYAREEGGVLSPSQFIWLRAHDRTLWYPLNNMGRQSFHMEALGAMAHYKAEKLTQRPIPVPKVQDAVSTITEYMKSDRARPIPSLDYSKSKQKGVKKAI
ncbi:MAG: type IV secretion system protein [Alphaproteobacteria bacterium]|nr:type IV secretion system protein [Alphaproteobacteria bacterium]QQS58506.1 MAG: type IV secretion system protein [Alphaproteobacteria bacterium]